MVWLTAAAVLAVVLRRPRVLTETALTLIVAEIVSAGLKEVADRDRPPLVEPLPEPLVELPVTSSFPSGHATTAFAGAVVLARFVPRLLVPLLVLAASVAWSRVVVGVHYPLDVLAGALLGAAIGFAVPRALRRLPAGRPRSAPPPPPA